MVVAAVRGEAQACRVKCEPELWEKLATSGEQTISARGSLTTFPALRRRSRSHHTTMAIFRFLLLALALVSTSALRVPVATTRVASRSAAAQMAMPSLEDARSLSTDEIEAEIVAAKKVRGRR